MSGRKPLEPAGAIARRLGVVQAAPKVPSAAQRDLVEQGVSIFQETPSAQDAAFIARELVLASLPHSNPGDRPVWMRRNGGPLDFGAKSAGTLFLKTWAKMPGTSITF